MNQNKYIIKNASVYDGLGSDKFQADILIDNGIIKEIGNIGNVDCRTIDIKGNAIAPGFIDVHSHDDIALIVYPEMDFKVMQGVTTVINGNCGNNVIPRHGILERWQTRYPDNPIPEWNSYDDYIDLINSIKPSVNSAILIGHGSVRNGSGLKNQQRLPNLNEYDQMKGWIREGMEAGAVGFSTGLIYEPGRYSSTEEIIELTKVISPYDGVYSSHMRNEGNNLLLSIEETIKIGQGADTSIEISHHKVSGKDNWGLSKKSTEMINEARDNGINVHSDQYPYIAGQSALFAIHQNNAFNEGEGGLGTVSGDKVIIAHAPLMPEYEGKKLSDICDDFDLPEQEAAEKILSQDPHVLAIIEGMCEEDLVTILSNPHTMIGSDGVPASGANPHPRLYGCFPRVLGKYARDEKIISMETAIYKMTGLPAKKFNLNDRGTIEIGKAADLVVFNPDTVIDLATYEKPRVYSEGIVHVIVNGTFVVNNSEHTGSRVGKIIKRSS